MNLDQLRGQISDAKYCDERTLVEQLIERSDLEDSDREEVRSSAVELIERCRNNSHQAGTLDAFLQEFGLSNKEGIALMCLAESLLRIPDADTADRIIAENIHSGDWKDHNLQSSSMFVNASVWGLMLTGKMIPLNDSDDKKIIPNLIHTLTGPVVRNAINQAMKIMGGQYVLGRSLGEALKRGRRLNEEGTLFSFDMLGEGARTQHDADRYFESYADAIRNIPGNDSEGVENADGISIKLSALYHRFEATHWEKVSANLLPKVKQLAIMAKNANIGFSLDAEEADRLDMMLDIFETLVRDEEFKGWNGLGFVLQAYQKRAVDVANWLAALSREAQSNFMVRLEGGLLGLRDQAGSGKRC